MTLREAARYARRGYRASRLWILLFVACGGFWAWVIGMVVERINRGA